MTTFEVVTTLFGKKNVRYVCPHCKEVLLSSLTEAGTHDECPACHVGIVVPGYSELLLEQDRLNRRESKRLAKFNSQRRLALVAIARLHDYATEASKTGLAMCKQLPRLVGRFALRHDPPYGYGLSFKLTLLIIGLVLFARTFYNRNAALRAYLNDCPSSQLVDVDTYYDGLFRKDVIVFDVLGASQDNVNGSAAVYLLLQFCENANFRDDDRIILAWNGHRRFHLVAGDLKPVLDDQVRFRAIMQVPARVQTPDGKHPYPLRWGRTFNFGKLIVDYHDFVGKWLEFGG